MVVSGTDRPEEGHDLYSDRKVQICVSNAVQKGGQGDFRGRIESLLMCYITVHLAEFVGSETYTI